MKMFDSVTQVVDAYHLDEQTVVALQCKVGMNGKEPEPVMLMRIDPELVTSTRPEIANDLEEPGAALWAAWRLDSGSPEIVGFVVGTLLRTNMH